MCCDYEYVWCGGLLDGKPKLLNVYKYFICVIHTIQQEHRYTINDISLFAACFPFESV